MEAVGLGVGVLGLAGLFTACLDAIDRVKDYKSYTFDSDASRVQFEGCKHRLGEWGRKVGLKRGQPGGGDHDRLKDPEVRSLVEDTLNIINQIISDGGNQPSLSRRKTGDLNSVPGPGSTRQKLAWVLGGKGTRADQLALLGALIDQLHSLVPVTQIVATKPDNALNDSTWITDMRQALADIQAEKRRAVHAWILGDTSSWDSQERFKDACKKRISGTCDWVLERPVFQQWSSVDDPSPGLLWIHGGPGFGKTILSSRIVEYLLQELPDGSKRTVAQAFYSAEHASRSDPYTIMRCWLSQLASHPTVFALVSQAHGEDKSKEASRETLVELLRRTNQEVPHLFLVIDGLDECSASAEDTASIPRFLNDLLYLLDASLRIVVVSRNETSIRQVLRYSNCIDHVTEYEISKNDVQADTNAYSLAIVEQKLPTKDPELKGILAQSMSERCEGQFLWLKLQGPSLKEWQNPQQLQKTLDKVPKGLDKIYERTWDALLRRDEFDRAVTILRWATFAWRPLTLDEVAVAALINEGSDHFNTEDLPDEISKDYVQSEILDVCGSFLELRQDPDEPALEKGTIHLQHFTVKQFLLAKFPIDVLRLNDRLQVSNEQKQHSILLRHCIWYIRASHSSGNQNMSQLLKDYAYSHWPAHARATPLSKDSETVDIIMAFAYGSRPEWQAYTRWYHKRFHKDDTDNDTDDQTVNDFKDLARPGSYLLSLDLDEVFLRRLHEQPSAETLVDNDFSPFITACTLGKASVVQSMLDSEVDITKRTTAVMALNAAILSGSPEVVKILLEHEPELNEGFHDSNTGTLLANAVNHGHPNIVRLLLEAGADPKVSASLPGRSASYGAVHLAARAGHLQIMQLLHAFGADIDAPATRSEFNAGGTPLLMATIYGHAEVACFLVVNGADIDTSFDDGTKFLLSWAFFNSCEAMVDLPLRLGARVGKGNTGTPLLSVAAHRGHLGVVKLILQDEHSRNFLDHTDGTGWSALCAPARSGNTDTIDVLLEAGADPSFRTWYGMTPLFMAVVNGHLDAAEHLMLKDTFSSKQQGWMGRNLAWWARRSGNLDVTAAVDRYIESPTDDTVPDGTVVVFDDKKWCCDACSMTIVGEEAYFCADVGVRPDHTSICEDCYAWGMRCFDRSHVEMEKLTFDN